MNENLRKVLDGNAFKWGMLGLILLMIFIPGLVAAKPIGIIFVMFIVLIGIQSFPLWASLFNWFKNENKSLAENPFTHFNVRIGSYLIAGLFIVSGFVKLQDPLGFSYKLNEYWNVFGTDFMVPLSLPLAMFVSVFEVALAIALITGYKMRITSWLLLLMIVFFTFLTGFSAITESVTDCGCFGDALKLTPWETFTKDLILCWAILPIFLTRNDNKEYFEGKLPAASSWGSLILFMFFSIWCWMNLPVMDFRPYKIGTNMYECTIGGEWNNFEPHCHDYLPLGMGFDCDGTQLGEFQGNKLLFIVNKLEKANDNYLVETVALAKALEGSEVGIIGASSSGSRDRDPVIAKHNIEYCIVPMDETVLKTIIRSNPGYLLLKEGKIMGKWPNRSAPSKEEILSLLQ